MWGDVMPPASSAAAATKDVALERSRHLRRWPLLWSASFAIGVSLALWAGIFVLVGWVLHLGAPHA
jgi:hypothetical protein